MEKNGEIFVSESTRRTVLDAIRLDINNGRIQDIDRAIDIFRERIEGRYLNPIRQLNKDPFKNGFASMALCCLLIDTFYQFENGLKKTMENKKCYQSFLWDNLRDIFGTKKRAERFYKDIRCGILHSAQTYNGSRLSCDQSEIIIPIKSGYDVPISVSVIGFSNRLERYFEDYCYRLRVDEETQRNFANKIVLMFGDVN